ncbi:MAG: RHS repeat-associated core domain-containing protein, partial [bacterium]|nr:RHS repeat-associated core domain-containing protein [bacterium]
PRLVWGNDRAWTYTDYDGLGHTTLRVEQRGDAPVPECFPVVATNLSTLSNAFVTMADYTPLDGDAAHADDAAKPRVETRWLVRNGAATLVGRTWHRYTRLVRGGYDAIRHETWRAASQGAAFGDASNAYSHEIVYADTGAGTPLLMRGASAESLDEDGILTVNVHSLPSTNVLSCATRRRGPDGTTPFPTYEVVERDAQYGTVLRRTTRLAADDTVVADEQSLYDSQNRLRSTTYLDGTSLTNAYSCCRLLWSVDREGRRTRRSALTGSDHLYNAIEDEWLADVSTNGMFRVTQHFFDALGRETNTVVYAGSTPGEATNSLASAGKALSSETTVYPDGDSDYAVRTDARGKVTVSRTDVLGDCVERGEAVFTNGVEVVRTKTRSYFGGGSSTRREWDGDRFTEERSFDDYLADGRRVAYVLTDSSDCGTVTNSVTTYDLLGRVVSVDMPLGVTSNVYDGMTSRLLASINTADSIRRETFYLYNGLGEQVGTVQDGVTNRADVAYEFFSNQWWRVTREATVGPSTNALAVTSERLTGLSDDVRSQIIRKLLAGDREETLVSYDPATGSETKTVDSSWAGRRILESRHGIELSSADASGVTTNRHDALGRRIRVEKGAVVREYAYDVAGSLVETRTPTATNDLVEAYRYDMLGRRVETVDALGQSTYRAYDPLGNVTAEWGATYPVRYEYDTAGRRTALGMTLDGVVWNWTRWTFDPVTGLCLRKTYADGSFDSYSYTADGLIETTAFSGGNWITNLYDARRQLVGTVSSDGTQDTAYVRDAYGRIIGESNAVAQTELTLNEEGVVTGESRTDGTDTVSLERNVDGLNRLSGLFVPSLGYAEYFTYTEDNLISAISNEEAVVTYTYSPDRQDAGYTISFASGGQFSRTVVRDLCRREVVTAVTNVCGASILGLAYTHDGLSRPIARNNDEFSYNGHGEVSFAEIAGNVEKYAYDLSGNSLWASFNSVTNHYTANNLNQYSSISTLCASAPLRETIPHYDADGNLVSFGAWSYTYDAASQLVSVSSNGVLLVTNQYDCRRRRVKKITPDATHTFLYDDWNLIRERVDYTNGVTDEFNYYWGRDLSGTVQGAGGVGGLLYVKRNGVIYVPHADANGNILRYTDTTGNIVSEYTYDAFGRAILQSGPLADVFRHRFSSKYFDVETGLYYYGYRFYSPVLMRWLNRDPLAERGGLNLYGFCGNNATCLYDADGRAIRIVKNGHVITVTVNITIYYANRIELNARTDLARIARRIKKQIEEKWNSQTWRYGCCTVKFKANVKYRNQVGRRGIVDDNVIAITTDANHRSYVNGVGGNSGYWTADNKPGSDWRYAHEAGHLMGLDDDYDAQTGLANPGHEGHMMAEWGKPVQQHEVEEILRINNVRCDE